MMRTALLILLACSLSATAGPMSSQPEGFRRLTGYIDPTVSTYNGNKPMQCTASATPGAAYTEQNRATLQVAINSASSTHQWIMLPRCSVDTLTSLACPADDSCAYPISRRVGAGVLCGVDYTNLPNVVIIGYGAILRMSGNLGLGDSYLACLYTTSGLKFIGLTFSQRDVTNVSEQTHVFVIGKTTTNQDDIEWYRCRWIEGQGGDALDTRGSGSNTRMSVLYNTFDGVHRDAVDFSGAYYNWHVIGNTFHGTGNQDLDNEPTVSAIFGNTVFAQNILDRTASSGSAASFTGKSGGGNTLVHGFVFAENQVIDGFLGLSLNCKEVWIVKNMIYGTRVNDSLIGMQRRAHDVWITDNYLSLEGVVAGDQQVIGIAQDFAGCAEGGVDCLPHDFWISRNRIRQFSYADAVRLNAVRNVWGIGNDFTYHNAADDVGATSGFAAFRISSDASTALSVTSDWFAENRLKRDKQADGTTDAGRTQALVTAAMQFTSTLGHLTIRDNDVDGAAAFVRSSVTTSQMVEGTPVITGNHTRNVPSFMTSGMIWTTDSDPLVERVSGTTTLSPSMLATLAGDGTYTQPDGLRSGQLRSLKVTSKTAGGTWTPTHFGDGTSVTWSTNGAHLLELWDADAGKWWLLDQGGMTVVP